MVSSIIFTVDYSMKFIVTKAVKLLISQAIVSFLTEGIALLFGFLHQVTSDGGTLFVSHHAKLFFLAKTFTIEAPWLTTSRPKVKHGNKMPMGWFEHIWTS